MTKEEAIAFLETLEASDEIKNPLALLESLRNANAEAKTNREALEEAQTKLAEVEEFKTASKATAIERELKAAGVKNADRIVRLMKTEDIQLDNDGSLKGFDEQFETTKTAWPELFDPKLRAPKVEQFEDKTPQAKMSATEQQLAQLRAAQGIS